MGRLTLQRGFTDVNGIRIFYRDTFAGSETLLLLHGRWGRGETWTDLMRRYHDRYRIIAPDQRGHGLSDKPEMRYSASDFAQDMYEFIMKVDCAPVTVIGHSMGAISRDCADWYGLLDKIRCPVMPVRASESWCLSQDEADKIREAVPGCYYCEISGSDHMVYASNPDKFYPRFDRFLDSILPPT